MVSESASRRARFWRVIAATGVALLASGVTVGAAWPPGGVAWRILMALGALAIIVALAANRSAVAAFTRRRAARRGADAVLSTLFFTAILVVVQATSVRRSHQFDLTRNQRNTLAPQTVAVLDSLDAPVNVSVFFRQNSPARQGAENLLSLYARRSRHFQYELIDPDRNPDRAQRLEVTSEEMIVESKGVTRRVSAETEEGLTNAIVQVTRDREKPVYFVTGHGEKDIDGGLSDGYRAAATSLAGQGYSVRKLSLVGTRDVPADCSVLVIAGPSQDYLEEEVQAVSTYLRRGGSALIMLEPRVELPRLSTILERYRIEMVGAVVLDDLVLDAGERTFDPTVAKIRRYDRHAITRGFNFVTMYPRAQPVLLHKDTTIAGLESQYLGVTDDEAWGETDMSSFEAGRASRDGVDIAGPLPISAVATRSPFPAGAPGGTSRVVVVGDSDFAGNSFFGVLGNGQFFKNAVAFLAEDENLISIRPPAAPGDNVYITEGQGRMVFAVCLVLLPLAPIATGAWVMLRRRRT